MTTTLFDTRPTSPNRAVVVSLAAFKAARHADQERKRPDTPPASPLGWYPRPERLPSPAAVAHRERMYRHLHAQLRRPQLKGNGGSATLIT